jgi:hypothetical protein
MPLPASGQISLKDILEEKNITYVSAIQRIRLKGLSVDGSAISEADYYDSATTLFVNVDGTPNSSAPYAMSEFHSYDHNPDHTVSFTRRGPVGKISIYTSINLSNEDVPFGTTNISEFRSFPGGTGLKIIWGTSRNDSWNSVIWNETYELTRTGSFSTTSTQHTRDVSTVYFNSGTNTARFLYS